jgi:hypothetical protein
MAVWQDYGNAAIRAIYPRAADGLDYVWGRRDASEPTQSLIEVRPDFPMDLARIEEEATRLLNADPYPPIDYVPPEPPVSAAAPTVTSLSPNTAPANDPTDITMTVNGTGFVDGSTIYFNDLEEPTTFISETAVSTGVKPSLFEVPDTCPVDVRNPDGQRSGSMDFTFT